MTLRELHEELTRLLDDDGPDGALGDTEVLMTANYGDISNNEECYHIRCVAITTVCTGGDNYQSAYAHQRMGIWRPKDDEEPRTQEELEAELPEGTVTRIVLGMHNEWDYFNPLSV